MSEITGNIMADLKKENDFATEAKKMMKPYEEDVLRAIGRDFRSCLHA